VTTEPGSPRAGAGVLGASYALIASLIVGFETAVASQAESLLLRASIDPVLQKGMLASGQLCAATLVLLGVPVWIRATRRPARSHGRLRTRAGALSGLLNALGIVAIGFAYSGGDSALLGFDGFSLRPAPHKLIWAQLGLGLLVTGGLGVWVCAITSWQLLRQELRRRIWLGLDALLVVAVVAATLRLPADPAPEDSQALALAVLRHVLTTIGVLRLTARFLPPLMSVVERVAFHALVAVRHLRSKKSGFLATISVLSVLAVTTSSCALTTTLSVMGGFRNDLKRKILGNNAHIVIDRDHATIEGWTQLLQATRGVPEVSGVSPFLSGEVMLSSASNLATAVLKGIDPKTVGDVSDLPRNLTRGKLEYLASPEKLLRLPADSVRGLFPLKARRIDAAAPRDSAEPDAGAADAGGAPEAAPAPAGTAAAGAPGADAGGTAAGTAPGSLEERIATLDEYLKKAIGPQPEANRDVLPGIIIGQELARSLRLYLGDEVNVVAPLGALGPSGPMPKARPFRVAGIFYSGMYEYDMKFTYVALSTAQSFLGSGDAISGLEVKVRDVDQAPATAASVIQALGRSELRVRDWQELNSRLFGALELEKLAMFIALGIAILVASFCIAGTLTLMVQEKGREVAILKAMGTTDRAVVGVFLIEGGLIGLLGAVLGCFLGYMMCFAAEHFGVRMNPEVYYIDRLPVHVDLAEFALTGVAAVGICLMVTIYPALLASRLRPVDALRYE
jgi:lipoprotein-releasing system permease protein